MCIVRFLNQHGYEWELKKAQEIFDVSKHYTVASAETGLTDSAFKFDGIPGKWNSVMFEIVSGTPNWQHTYSPWN